MAEVRITVHLLRDGAGRWAAAVQIGKPSYFDVALWTTGSQEAAREMAYLIAMTQKKKRGQLSYLSKIVGREPDAAMWSRQSHSWTSAGWDGALLRVA